MPPRSVVIVQARIGSTRLPGKVLLDLGGKSVLAHVLERAAAIGGADLVCCAVPDTPENDPVAALAARLGAVVVRGSENDVLDRYYEAAVATQADIVVRVTSDCPLLDPALGAQVLAAVARDGYDYATNDMPPLWPQGLDVEAFSFAWLERAARQARLPSEREHVTQFIRNHPDVRLYNAEGPGGAIADHRWTLDTEADLRFLRAVVARLPAGEAGWGWRAALSVVEADPALALINAGQDRLAGLKTSLEQDAQARAGGAA